MSKATTGGPEVLRLRQSIETQMHRRILGAIEPVLEGKLTEALGTGRYARRTREVDEAILGAYLAGANTRRIRKALAPLLGEEHLSKSAVSRVASRLEELFRRWSDRDVSEETYAILLLDGFHLKVRMARRVVSVPVLAVLGVAEDGRKHLVAPRLALRTTNALENLNRELRRRTKTQASFSTEEAAVTLLYGLVAFGQIQLRKIDSHRNVSALPAPSVAVAA